MKTITVLFIGLTFAGEDLYYPIPFKSPEACGAALSTVLPEVQKDWPDAIGLCKPTEIVWASDNPRRRPVR